MKLFTNPELKGKLGLVLGVLLIGLILMALSGKFEQWFGIAWFSGAPVTDRVAFLSDVDDSAELCIMGTDGSDRKQLTQGAKASSSPAVSPTGTKIAFVATFGKSEQVYSIGGEPGEATQITVATGPKKRPGYLSQSKRLTYISSGRLYTSELDGGAVETILPTHQQIQMAMMASNPIPGFTDYAWDSTETSLIAISRTDTGDENLVFQPKSDAEVTSLIPPGTPQPLVQAIAGAKDKSVFAAVIAMGKERLLLLIDPASTEPSQQVKVLAKMAGDNVTGLCFSDDGTKLALAVNLVKAGPVLSIIDLAAGGPPAGLAQGSFESLSFNPDGDQILATQIKGDKRDIVVVDLTSREIKQLTTDGASYNAIWTPQGGK